MMNEKLLKPFMLFFALLLVLGNILGFHPITIEAASLESAVTVSAQNYEGEEVLPLTAVSFDPGDDAYDVLKAATDQNNIELETKEYGSMGHYITKIGDVEEDMPYYWSFNTQGVYSDVGVSSYKVKNGDNLTFTTVSMEDGMNAPTMTVTVSAVDGEDNPVIDETEVDLTIRSTAYDALYQAAKAQDVDLDVSVDEDLFTFINNIDDTELAENDYWNLTINGDAAQKGAVQSRLEDGDTVQLEVQSFDDASDSDNGEQEENEEPSEGNTDENSPDQDIPSDSDEIDESDKSSDNKANYDVTQHMDDLFNYVDQNISLEYGSEWWIWGLAHTDYPVPDSYIDSVKEKVKEANGEFRSFELQKIIIALSLLGEDVTDYDLIDILVDDENNPYPGINGDIYTLIAVDSGHYDVPEGYRENLIESILKQEKDNGGWALFGSDPTIDITAMVLASLAPYQDNPEVKAATDRAVNYLSEEQENNGGFYETFTGGDTSESISQVIVALSSLGIDPTGDLFTKDGGNLLEHLAEFQQDDGGYSHVLDSNSMPMSSEQALLAYVAYEKYSNDSGLVYQQPVIDNGAGEEPEEPGDQTKPDPNPEEPGNPSKPDPNPEEPKDPIKPDPNPEEPENPTNPDPNPEKPGNLTNPNDNGIDRGDNQANDDDNDNNNTLVPASNDDGTPGSDSGNKLPNTATTMFNYLLIGLLFVMVGAVLLVIKRRKSAKL
ncbi:DUF4430 domain-containing protein [Lentibacillus sp. N15]|uniref:DUF4430 domain-containing protein n=1 Tax=Lentibacillus songyuanensis TaxID=3136161 RepID=UPI0031BA63ED